MADPTDGSAATRPVVAHDIATELDGLADLADLARLGVNIVDPAPLRAAADTIRHLRALDAKRQQEIERLLARIAQLETNRG